MGDVKLPEDQQQNPANVPLIYANNIRLAMSFADVRIFFGEALPSAMPTAPPGEAVHVSANPQSVDRVCIIISPDLIPTLASGLAKATELYQAQFGPLRKPPHSLPQPPEQKA